jgi:hypothetical protein
MPRRSRIIISIFLSIGFLVFSYWVTNLRFPISGEKTILTKLELIHDYFCPRENESIDSVLFVNVAYDKELRPIVDEYGTPSGKTQITNRQKLLRLLQYLRKSNDYKFILLDVFFENDVQTEWDEELYATIESMKRIVIPRHSDAVLADNRLAQKAGLADYLVTFSESDFVKYPYYCDTAKSVPIKMYEEVSGRSVEKHGIFFTDGWHLVRSSIVLTFDLRANETYADNGDKIWNNLGMDLLDDTIPELNALGDSLLYKQPEMTRGKYIVIGSFHGDDTHTTYLEEMAGAVIIFNAFISLLNGHHIVSATLASVLFIVFFLLSYLTISRKRLKDLLKELAESSHKKSIRTLLRGLIWMCSWMGYSLLLTIMCIVTYITLGEAYDIFITATLFYLFNLSITLYDKIHKKIRI